VNAVSKEKTDLQVQLGHEDFQDREERREKQVL